MPNEKTKGGQPTIEQQNIRLVEERNKIERNKYIIGFISILISITIAIVAYVHHFNIQEQRAMADFEIKAMEIVLKTDKPEDMRNKAKIMVGLFPTRLPKDLSDRIADMYGLPH